MKSFRFILTAAVAATALTAMAGVRTANLSKARLGNEVRVRFDIVLDDLKLGSNQQLYITPGIQEGDSATVLPAVLVLPDAGGGAVHEPLGAQQGQDMEHLVIQLSATEHDLIFRYIVVFYGDLHSRLLCQLTN